MPISGLGPHGERGQSPDLLRLSDEEIERARAGKFKVALVLHTTKSDWAKQHLVGIAKTLGDHGAALIDVADCSYDAAKQVAHFERLIADRPDAIISIPVGNSVVAESHRNAAKAGIKVILLDNVPTGLLPERDYVSLISADNFGLGEMAAQLLSPHMAPETAVGILAYDKDFFATNEREIAFRRWIEIHRPDLRIQQSRFSEALLANVAMSALVNGTTKISGVFAVWDEVAMPAIRVLKGLGISLPMTTVDLGDDVALALAEGEIMQGIAAQRPYDQGVAAARSTILSLIGRQPPPWVALPGLAVTRETVIQSYQVIWHMPPSPELVKQVLRAQG